MTIKQIAEAAGVSAETVSRKVKELFPERVKNGKTTNLIQQEAVIIMTEIRKKNFVLPLQNEDVPLQNDKVPTENREVITRSDLAVFGAAIVSEMMKQFIPLINNQKKQIEFVQDYFTIKGYSNKIGQVLTFSEALALGRIAGKLSREQGVDIRKAEDEKYGYVNSYALKILQEVFTA